MARCLALFAALFQLFFATISLAAQSTETPHKHWLATLPPLYSLLQVLVRGTEDKTALLLSGGQDPHHFALRPTQAKLLESADLVFFVHPQMEAFLAQRIENNDELFYSPYVAQHNPADIAVHGWLSPVQTRNAVKLMAEKLANESPKNKSTYQYNSDEYSVLLNEHIKKWQAVFQGKIHRRIAVDSIALDGFAADFSLQPLYLNKNFNEISKAPDIKCLFVTHSHSSMAEKIAKITNKRVITLNTMEKIKGEGVMPYRMFMDAVVQQISACLT